MKNKEILSLKIFFFFFEIIAKLARAREIQHNWKEKYLYTHERESLATSIWVYIQERKSEPLTYVRAPGPRNEMVRNKRFSFSGREVSGISIQIGYKR